jgi:membrane associated rhomboid family serine protease
MKLRPAARERTGDEEVAVFPYDDRTGQKRRRFPFVLVILVLINILVFVYQLTLSPEALEAFVRAWGVTPAEITAGQDLPPTIPVPVYLTLVTSMFIHGGFLHILVNLVFLWIFGDNVEDALGHLTFLFFYMAAGVFAGLANAFLLTDSTVPGIGASGAVAAVLAGYLLLFPRAEVRVLLILGPFLTVGRIAALLLIGIWFVLQVWQGVGTLGAPVQEGGVAYFAHIGGFMAGLIMMFAIRTARGQRFGRLSGGFWIGPIFRNWLLLALALAILFGATSLLAGMGMEGIAALVQGIIVLAAALFALVDGVRRIAGQPSFLGSGIGPGRLLAFLQVLIVLGLLAGVVLGIG